MGGFSKVVLVLILLVSSLSCSFALCDLNSSSLNLAQITYVFKDDSSAEAMMVFGVDYPKECLFNEFVNVDVSGNSEGGVSVGTMEIVSDEVPCPQKYQEAVLKSFPGLSSGINCYGQYYPDRNYLQMNFYGQTQKLSLAVDKNYSVFFTPSEFTNNFSKNSFLTLIFPEGSTINLLSSQRSNFSAPSVVNLSPFPKEQIGVNYFPYDLQKDVFNRVLPILVLVSIIFLFITALSVYFMRVSIVNSEKGDLADKMDEIKGKLKRLENDYMLRKLDETTFRRLFEQYHVQLNDFESELAKLDSKKGPVGGMKKLINLKNQESTEAKKGGAVNGNSNSSVGENLPKN